MPTNSVTFSCPLTGMTKLNDSEVHFAMQIIKRLKEKGVPVLGHISIRGVEYGKLICESTATDLTFTWIDGPDLRPKAPPPATDFDDEEEL